MPSDGGGRTERVGGVEGNGVEERGGRFGFGVQVGVRDRVRVRVG